MSEYLEQDSCSPRLIMATGLVATMLALATPAIAAGPHPTAAAPASQDMPLPMCTPGIEQKNASESALGLYEVGEGWLIADVVVDAKAAANCLKGTAANLTLNVGGVPLNLGGGLEYSVISGPQRLISATTINPVMCESFYIGTDRYALQLTNSNNDLQGAGGLLGGVLSLSYSTTSGSLMPDLHLATYGPWLRCFDATTANATFPASEADQLFSASFENRSDLRVEYLNGTGSRIDSLVQTINTNSSYRVRVSNRGEAEAKNVRVREFVPKTGGLLAPTMTPVSCTRELDSSSCAGTDGTLQQSIPSLLPGESRVYALVRQVNGSSEIPVQSGALTSVAVFTDPDQTGETNAPDNSRSLRIGLITNAAPVANSQSLGTLEDAPISITLTASDAESDPLTFATGTPTSGSLSGTAPNLLYTPAADFNGNASFTFTASDATGTSAPATVSISITAVNDAPRINASAPLVDVTVAEGSFVEILTIGAFTDPEGDALGFSAANLPVGLSIGPSGGVIQGNLSLTTAGIYNVVVTATETGSGGLSVDQPFVLTVTNTNQAPTLAALLADRNDDEGDAISVNVSASFADADPGDVLTFAVTAGALPAGLSLDSGSGLISGTISQVAAAGSPYSVTITANDGQTGTVSDTFEWIVNPVNASPVAVGTLADRSGNVGVFINIPGAQIRAGFADPDGDTLSYSATGLPPGLLISPSDGTILGTPDAGTEGPHSVVVTATDPGTLSATQAFTFTIAN